MITIVLNEKEYQLPNEWIDISIGQLQSIANIDPSIDEVDKIIEILNIISGIPKDELLESPATEYRKLIDTISFINSEIPEKLVDYWEYDGVKYKMNLELTKMSTAECLDLDTFSKNSDSNNLHILMAIISRPEGEKYNSDKVYERAEIFKEHMPISIAVSAQLFMQVLDLVLQNNIQDSLTKEELK